MKTLVCAIQMTSTDNKAENLDQAEALIADAAQFKARLVGLPENFLFLAKPSMTAFSAAETIEGPSITRLKNIAKKHKLWLSLGGFPEQIHEHDKIYNTHLVISDKGEVCAQYRKIHLFCAHLPDGSIYDEAKGVMPGDKIVCLKTPFFSLGLSICYDLRFAHLYSALRDQNADVILVPAAFTEETGKAHWEVLLRARAIETQSYIIAAAQAGKHHENRSTHGHAMIVDPWGVIIAQCGKNNGLAIAEIDMDFVKNLRQQMPTWQHRRLINS